MILDDSTYELRIFISKYIYNDLYDMEKIVQLLVLLLLLTT